MADAPLATEYSIDYNYVDGFKWLFDFGEFWGIRAIVYAMCGIRGQNALSGIIALKKNANRELFFIWLLAPLLWR